MTRDEEEQMISKVDSELFKWTVSAILGLVSSFGTIWLTKIQNQLDQVTHDFYLSGKQISALETHVETVNKRLDRFEDTFNKRFDRVEFLIDAAIGTRSSGRPK